MSLPNTLLKYKGNNVLLSVVLFLFNFLLCTDCHNNIQFMEAALRASGQKLNKSTAANDYKEAICFIFLTQIFFF